MIARNKKIHLNKDFDLIFKAGRSQYGRFLGLKFLFNNKEYSRFACLVSNKIEKKSFKRHRLKRVVYAWLDSLELPFFADYVIIFLPAAKGVDEGEIKQDFINIFSKIKKKND